MTSSCILMSICVLIYVNKVKKLFFRFCRTNKFKSVLLFFLKFVFFIICILYLIKIVVVIAVVVVVFFINVSIFVYI